MKSPIKSFALATASLGLVFGAAPAFAGESDTPTRTVSTAGLNLATPEGQRMLDQRISTAAREVCKSHVAPVGVRVSSAEARECVAKAKASAQSQVASLIQEQQLGG